MSSKKAEFYEILFTPRFWLRPRLTESQTNPFKPFQEPLGRRSTLDRTLGRVLSQFCSERPLIASRLRRMNDLDPGGIRQPLFASIRAFLAKHTILAVIDLSNYAAQRRKILSAFPAK